MGELVKNPDGTHTFKGGFSTKNPEDVAQARVLMEDKLAEKGFKLAGAHAVPGAKAPEESEVPPEREKKASKKKGK